MKHFQLLRKIYRGLWIILIWSLGFSMGRSTGPSFDETEQTLDEIYSLLETNEMITIGTDFFGQPGMYWIQTDRPGSTGGYSLSCITRYLTRVGTPRWVELEDRYIIGRNAFLPLCDCPDSIVVQFDLDPIVIENWRRP